MYAACVCKTNPGSHSASGNKSSGRKSKFGETKFVEEVVEEDTDDDEVPDIFTAKDSVHLPVVYEQQELVLPLIVVDGDGPPLLGRNWLEQLKLNWSSIFHVSKADTLSDVLNRHKNVFDKGLGTINHQRFKTELNPESQHYLTVNTHKGLYAYQRLTYVIASAPALFQSTLDQILQGMDNVRCRIDENSDQNRTQ
ncbi:hypothetical protein ACROYT_G016318 [Oculina patagonica]